MTTLVRRRSRDQRGSSLVELAMTMGVFSILLIALGTLYIGSLRSAAGTQARLTEIQDGRIAMSAMGRSLRTAILPSQLYDAGSTEQAAFIEATPLSIRFFANIDNPGNTVGPSKVTYSVTNGALIQTVQPPLPQWGTTRAFFYCTPGPTCPVRTTVLARGVLTTQPIFRYYDVLGAELTGGALTPDQLQVVDSVDISVTVAQRGSGGDGTTYALRVALPNHDAVVRAENKG